MPEQMFGELMSALDLIVLERQPGGALVQLGGHLPPAWFTLAFNAVGRRQDVTLLEAFPILDSFLSEADAFWNQKYEGRLDGEPFVISNAGRNLPLVPTAVAMKGRAFLLLQRVPGFEDRQDILQRARERALEHEQVLKQIDGLARPLAALSHSVDELEAMALDDNQRKRVANVREAVAALTKAFDALPHLPPTRRAQV